MDETAPTRRFSGREADYSRGRPGYPRGIIKFLEVRSDFSPSSIVADIGSGTGKLTVLFLENGNETFGVEPNQDMRREAEKFLGRYPNFRSVSGSAEKTGLPDKSVDLITAGQAFHWFDVPKAKKEFSRILRDNGFVFLVWNSRRQEKGSFGYDYEELAERNRKETNRWTRGEAEMEDINEFFGARNKIAKRKLANSQKMDLNELLARIRSASYIPNSGPELEKLELEIKGLFQKHVVDGKVTMTYDTEMFLGKIS